MMHPTTIIAAICVVLGAFVSFTATSVYDRVIDDPFVRREAVKDLVHKTELDAANARLVENARQLAAARDALQAFQSRLIEDNKAAAQALADLQRENAEYETKLKTQGRSCALDDGDIDWLRKSKGRT